jgi:FkbM family methyltransferase
MWDGLVEKIRIIQQQRKPVKFLLSRILMRLNLSHYLVIRKGDYFLRFYPTALSASLWINPNDRIGDEIFFQAYLKPGDAVIDVGANIGELTLLSARLVQSEGQVYSIEAHPEIFSYLKKNTEENRIQNVQLFNLALGEQSGTIHFSNISADDQNAVLLDHQGLAVEMDLLDRLPIEEDMIHLLKIDVEGYELPVLRGAEHTLSRVQCIYLECFQRHFQKYGYSCRDMFSFLLERNFRLYHFSGGRSLKRIPLEYEPSFVENILAIRDVENFRQRTGYVLE